jgi:hypothetical protein
MARAPTDEIPHGTGILAHATQARMSIDDSLNHLSMKADQERAASLPGTSELVEKFLDVPCELEVENSTIRLLL